MQARLDAALSALQNDILEAVATGVPFAVVADRLCRRAEGLAPGAFCTIAGIDAEGLIRPVAGPALPKSYGEALNGCSIGPAVGSCGTAAYFGIPVEVSDIATDYRWKDYQHLALPLGLKACWSSPIKSPGGRVVGTFAFYYREPRGPNDMERQLVDTCVHLCSIAMERDEVSRRLQHLAYHDQLTGLFNRYAFDETITQNMNEPARRFGLLLLDIDNLKQINDRMGHSVGDALICEVGRRLASLGSGINVYRLGGDEFAVICPECNDAGNMAELAGRLLGQMDLPYECDGNTILLQVTIGGVLSSRDGSSADMLRQNADLALYHAKHTARGGYVHFHPGLRTSIQCRTEQIAFLDKALDENRVFAHFQPIICMQRAKIVGVESLARIRTDEGKIISAGAFAMGLTDSKNAFRLTSCMLEQIASAMRGWIDEGLELRHVAVNLSTIDFQRGNLEQRLCAAFEAHNVPLHYLQIEVTENVLMDEEVASQVARLRAKGMQIALDDFGTGFASLSHLKDFPLDYIKIDKSFVDNLLTDTACSAIVEALISMAQKMQIGIVAEGVETPEQAARLFEIGCPLAQGYHFARPVDGETIATLLRSFDGKISTPALGADHMRNSA
ncbi:diguanylate cyclase (GGDEF) domain-containing protein [Hoeflea sp. IMCC20628]|uniref:bifunctional diguanylate cyclase/phosphodiesterase n=1 Tax=Hoeflea sp. IMCC20628 TaxID=1620421 RepID=UPI00063AE875|nr:EAL domain-containing protein [Hoeflea sp. IMCC20628]AKI03119.1 diguanylate cyclase (GGDEF) domain-containing protein [Hoeflea sp. IMCC20628]